MVPETLPLPARVLVTGAAGFIGLHVTRRLLDEGVEVLGLDSLNAYYDPALKRARLATLAERPGFAFETLDLAEVEALHAAFARFRPDAVIHLAAQAGVRHSIDAPFAYARANVDGFLAVLEACRRQPVGHLIYASSSSVYGRNTKVPFSETDAVERPSSLYAATKRANELMAETYAHLFAIPATGLRFFTVYGPWGRPDMAYWKFTDAILAGRPIEVYDEANMSRDFTYIDDVVEGVRRLLQRPPAGGPEAPPHAVFNIGNHRPEPLTRFIAAIETACGREAIRRPLPRQPGDVATTYADIDRLQTRTGFAPTIAIEEGIARFVGWFRGHFGR